jgi:hypothetical protein
VPLAEAIVVNRLLGQLGTPGKELLEKSASGEWIVTLALRDVAKDSKQLVPAGAVADAVLCLDNGVLTVWIDIARTAQQIHGAVPALSLDALKPATRTRIERSDATALFAAAVEEWKLLMAVQVAAAARRSLELAGEYSGQREAFGKKIGEFQGLAHPLANALTDVEGAQLLAWRAVDAIARGEKDAGAKVSMAYWWAGKAARPAALLSMRVFGGYGMTHNCISVASTPGRCSLARPTSGSMKWRRVCGRAIRCRSPMPAKWSSITAGALKPRRQRHACTPSARAVMIRRCVTSCAIRWMASIAS